jgi:mannose-1-phosphate guanylyltransferase
VVKPSDDLWVVILAAGEGKRVRHLTRDRWGLPAPKQFATIDGRSTLLTLALRRAGKLAPPERILAVVAPHHRRWWRSELACLPTGNVIVQPENRGTAAGILLPLALIMQRDASCRLVVLPSDHAVSSEQTLLDAIAGALACAPGSDSEIVLLGVRPDGPETGYGWVVPVQRGNSPLCPVASFREKPDTATAADLLGRGGLLNSFILIAGGRSLCNLFKTVSPQLWRSFAPILDRLTGASPVTPAVTDLYHSVPDLDFSRDLLERAAHRLRVYTVPPCGWLDLGSPERLTHHLLSQGLNRNETRTITPDPLLDGALRERHAHRRVLEKRKVPRTTRTLAAG